MWQHEPCFFGWEGHKPKRNPGDFPTSVWQIDVPILPGVESRHPTEKPIKLFTTPMLLHTKSEDICYEAFSGSGTSLCAAQTTERRCFAMEIESAFVAVALERLFDMGLKPKLGSRNNRNNKDKTVGAKPRKSREVAARPIGKSIGPAENKADHGPLGEDRRDATA
jgi:DNA modification methylase